MRRLAPFVLLGTGAFLLTSAPLLKVYAVPRLEVAPLDVNATSVATGVGRHIDEKTGTLSAPTTITATTRIIGDVAAGRAHGVAVWDISNRVDTPDTLKQKDPRKAFDWSVERWAFDRHTGRAVHCCGEKPRFEGEAYLKFPFHLEQRSYDVWDSTAKRAVEAKYVGTERMGGHSLYRYTAVVAAQKVGTRDLGGGTVLDQYYANAEESWLVDPRTGIVVTGSSHPHVTLRQPGKSKDVATLLDAELSLTADSVASDLAQLDDSTRRLALVRTYLPLAGLLGGGLGQAFGPRTALLVLALLMLPTPLWFVRTPVWKLHDLGEGAT
jgi:hypothetical protein